MWNQGGGFGGGGYGDEGGTGFINSPGGFGSPMPASQDKAKGRRPQNLMPATVAELLKSTDEDYKVGDVEVNMVTVVGLVREVQEAPTNILYKVDDMTGPPIDVRQWIDTDDAGDSEKSRPIPENTYVRVIGQLRTFGGKRNISAFKVQPLTDLNELTMHMMEVLHSHMYVDKAQKTAAMGMNGASHTNMQQMNTGDQGGYSGAQPALGLSNVQRQVQQIIQACSDETGVSVDNISRQLRNLSKDAIRNAIEFLSNEGHIYSTIDDDHFKSTDS
ncbi:replication protein A 32 kDa subunit-like [Ptychodera flava]|uniref:replication protein A 32 kDa subunit-like n=1 Tax=Ptychodera flava TaxID=63121 RepID=UPI003969C211